MRGFAQHHLAERYSVTMMHWYDAPTPNGRSRYFRMIDRPTEMLCLGGVGEKSFSWTRIPYAQEGEKHG